MTPPFPLTHLAPLIPRLTLPTLHTTTEIFALEIYENDVKKDNTDCPSPLFDEKIGEVQKG